MIPIDFKWFMLTKDIPVPDAYTLIDNDDWVCEPCIDGVRALMWWDEHGIHVHVKPRTMDLRRYGQLIDRSEHLHSHAYDMLPELYGTCLDVMLVSSAMTGEELWYYLDIQGQHPDDHIRAIAIDILMNDHVSYINATYEQRMATLVNTGVRLPPWISVRTTMPNTSAHTTNALQDNNTVIFKQRTSPYACGKQHNTWYSVTPRTLNTVYIYGVRDEPREFYFGKQYSVECTDEERRLLYDLMVSTGWLPISYENGLLLCIEPLGTCTPLSHSMDSQAAYHPTAFYGYATVDIIDDGRAVLLGPCSAIPEKISCAGIVSQLNNNHKGG